MRKSIRENDMEMQAKAKDAVTRRRTEGGRIKPLKTSSSQNESYSRED